MPSISVFIITKNEERNISRCLGSVRMIADEIIVVDDFSTDRTAGICREAGCKVILNEFKGYAHQKQFALDQATCDWALSVDADEEVSEGLQQEIIHWKQQQVIKESGYLIPFSLIYLGHRMRFSGTRNHKLRFFKRTHGHFKNVTVHEEIEIDGSTGRMKNSILHYSYQDLRHHLQKLNTYSSDAARGYVEKGKKFSRFRVAYKFPLTFFNFYFIRLGILDGYAGFMWSLLAAVYSSLKIAKTIELLKKS